MSEELQCVNAHPAKRIDQTVVRRCSGRIVPSPEEGKYMCSHEGPEVVFPAALVQVFAEQPLYHRAEAIARMIRVLTKREAHAGNASFPWIDIPLGAGESAIVETTTHTWDVHFERDLARYKTEETNIPAGSQDTEAIAHAISAILITHTHPRS